MSEPVDLVTRTQEPLYSLRVKVGRNGGFIWKLFSPSGKLVGKARAASRRPTDAIAEARNRYNWMRIIVAEEPEVWPYARRRAAKSVSP